MVFKNPTRLNDAGSTALYEDTTTTPTDSQNERFRVTISAAGVVTQLHEQNGVANGGTMAEPAGSPPAYTFDDGDVVIPYVTVHGATHVDEALLIKHLEVVRTPGTSYTN